MRMGFGLVWFAHLCALPTYPVGLPETGQAHTTVGQTEGRAMRMGAGWKYARTLEVPNYSLQHRKTVWFLGMLYS